MQWKMRRVINYGDNNEESDGNCSEGSRNDEMMSSTVGCQMSDGTNDDVLYDLLPNAGDDVDRGNSSSFDSTDGCDDVRTRLPRQLRRRLFRFRRQRVKHDIEHLYSPSPSHIRYP